MEKLTDQIKRELFNDGIPEEADPDTTYLDELVDSFEYHLDRIGEDLSVHDLEFLHREFVKLVKFVYRSIYEGFSYNEGDE